MISLKNKILNGYDDNCEEERAFISKYGFSLQDLETSINNWIDDNFICYSVKELAYEVCNRIYNEINKDEINDYYIFYKLIKSNGVYFHKIAFQYEDLYFIFDLCWRGSALCVDEWDLISENDFEQLKGYEDIECVLEDEEEE